MEFYGSLLNITLEVADSLIQKYHETLSEKGIQIEFGVSWFVNNIEQIKKAYGQSLCRLFSLPESQEDILLNFLTSDIFPKILYTRDSSRLRIYFWECTVAIRSSQAEMKKMYRIFSYCIYLCICNITSQSTARKFLDQISCLDNSSNSATEIAQLLENLFAGTTGIEKKNYHMCCEIVEYIDSNYSEDINLNMLSRKFFVSPNYLSTLFKKYMGISIHQYVTDVRLKAADLLMQKRQLKLYEIAEKIGYSDYEYFRKIYLRCRGKNPSEII
jgi:AraC-like DNA-binding protein